jgi:hypothetical protein
VVSLPAFHSANIHNISEITMDWCCKFGLLATLIRRQRNKFQRHGRIRFSSKLSAKLKSPGALIKVISGTG